MQDETITSWKELSDCLSNLEIRRRVGCRGESRKHPSLVPTIDRHFDPTILAIGYRTLIERELIKRFGQIARLHLTDAERELLGTALGQLTVMRHFGAPTRLIDWPHSPWIAAYFAASSDFDQDGFVYMFDLMGLESYSHRHHGSETNKTLQVDSKGLPLFLDATVSATLQKWVVPLFWNGPLFPRLVVQQGFFTIASQPLVDHWQYIRDACPTGSMTPSWHIRLSKDAKPEILQGLKLLGITASSLYPGIEGVCRELTVFPRQAWHDADFSSSIDYAIQSWTKAGMPNGQYGWTHHIGPPQTRSGDA